MLTTSDLPDRVLAIADNESVDVPARKRVGGSPALISTIDWWRVGVLALVATGHVVGIGVLALPDGVIAPAEPIQRRMVDASDSERLMLFVDLEPEPAPPLQPLPPAPVRLVVAQVVKPPPEMPSTVVAIESDAPTSVSAPVATPSPAPSRETAAVAATAAPAAAAAPSRPVGDPAQIRSDRAAYMRALMAALLQHRNYPPEARKQRARGTVHVRFSVDRDGHVLTSGIARGAGFPILETAALEVLRSADPLPPIPASLGVDRLTVTVPIEYSLITR